MFCATRPKILAAAGLSASAVLPSAIPHLVAVVPMGVSCDVSQHNVSRHLFEVQWPMEVQMHEVTG